LASSCVASLIPLILFPSYPSRIIVIEEYVSREEIDVEGTTGKSTWIPGLQGVDLGSTLAEAVFPATFTQILVFDGFTRDTPLDHLLVGESYGLQFNVGLLLFG
jgi:hypothetical protein